MLTCANHSSHNMHETKIFLYETGKKLCIDMTTGVVPHRNWHGLNNTKSLQKTIHVLFWDVLDYS